MKILISCAKGFQETDKMPTTTPVLQTDANHLVQLLKTYTKDDLQDLFGISEKLASENYERYQTFDETEKIPAGYGFDGMQYRNIKANTYDLKNMSYYQNHVRILSGLYGILKPEDGIVPYRLDMNTKLQIDGYKNLYQYYGNRIHQALDLDEKEILVNLASSEYSKVILPYEKDHEIIQVDFYEVTSKGMKMHSTASKKARGNMVRYCVENEILDPELLKSFKEDGYIFQQSLCKQEENVTTFVFCKEKGR